MDALLFSLAFALLSPILASAEPAPELAPAEASELSESPVYETEGVIRRIEKERSMITITHEEIPGYMRKMTMPFWVDDLKLFEGLAVDDEVSFRFRRGEKGKHFILSISKKKASSK